MVPIKRIERTGKINESKSSLFSAIYEENVAIFTNVKNCSFLEFFLFFSNSAPGLTVKIITARVHPRGRTAAKKRLER